MKTFIVGAARTAIGSFQGALQSQPAPALGVAAAVAALERTRGLVKEQVQEVFMGQVLQAGVGGSPARQVVMRGGFPSSTEATTINKVCASGMKAVMLAAQTIALGHAQVMIAGGMESMSNVPYYFPRSPRYGHVQALDGIMHDGLTDVYHNFAMGNCAEHTAKEYGITREEQDAYAARSYKLAAAAWEGGAFGDEVVPVEVKGKKKTVVVDRDEEYTKVQLERLPSLRPSFQADGTVTAANSSTLSDGAAAVVLVNREMKEHCRGSVAAEIISFADAAMDPIDFPIAPAKAMPIALELAGLRVEDMAKIEINEAFAAVVLANARLLSLDLERVNTRGGAVALGHPLGCSGARILVTLLHALKPGEHGMAAVCNAGGAASAMIVRRL